MGYWLLKSEPAAYSLADLVAAPRQTTPWEGVRNYQARNFLRALHQSACRRFRVVIGPDANRFHHDTNRAWETEAINDQALTHFCRRTLAFTQRS